MSPVKLHLHQIRQALGQMPSLFGFGNGNAAPSFRNVSHSRLLERIIKRSIMILYCLTGQRRGMGIYVTGNRTETLHVPDCFENGQPFSRVGFPCHASRMEGVPAL